VPAFDDHGFPFIRSRTASEDETSFVHVLGTGTWERRPFLAAARALYPDMVKTLGGGGRTNDRLIVDAHGVVYTVLTVRLASGAARNMMLWSSDACVTWTAAPLPDGLVVPEHFVGHNRVDGPPFLLIERPSTALPDSGVACYELLVTQPWLEGGALVVPPPVPVTDRALRIVTSAGGSSLAATQGDTTHVVWAEASDGTAGGSPTYVAAYDQTTATVGAKTLVAFGRPENDRHCTPAICADSRGYLHVLTGARRAPFRYTRSELPGAAGGGWTEPVDVLSSGFRTSATDADGLGQQTYVSLVCGPDDTLHLVFRQNRRGLDDYFHHRGYVALSYQRKPRGGRWSRPQVLVVPPYRGYAIYHQKLAIDPRGRLWLSCSCQSGPDLARWRNDVLAWELGGEVGTKPGLFIRRMVVTSPDGGHTWHLATTGDFVAGVTAAPVAAPDAAESATPRAATRAAADPWQWQDPLPQGNYLGAVSFADAQRGWAVGGAGTVVRTTDGGATWQRLPAATAAGLTSVAFADPARGCAVGFGGTIVQTLDGGASWTRRASGTSGVLRDIGFSDVSHGWAVGSNGIVLSTFDGGLGWWRVSTGATGAMNSVWSPDGDHVWVAGNNGKMVATTDGGASWDRLTTGTDVDLHTVCFVDPRTGWVAGEEGLLLRTTDGGTSWERGATGSEETLADVFFNTALQGWAVGAAGTLLTTTDGGCTWAAHADAGGTRLNGLVRAPGGACWAVGAHGLILGSGDLGATWGRSGEGTLQDLNGLAMAGDGQGWAVGERGTLLFTTDGGAAWSPSAWSPAAALRATCRGDGTTGWAVGDEGTVLTTTDGGAAWTPLAAPTAAALHDVDAAPGRLWLAGDDGAVLRSSDGGTSWSTLSTGTTETLRGVDFVDASHGWAVGGDVGWNDPAVVFSTTDGGDTWQRRRCNVRGALTDVAFADALRGWASGVDWGADLDRPVGVVLATTDGGQTWRRQVSTPGERLLGLGFVNPSVGWVVGDDGSVLRTVDGGVMWWRQRSGAAGGLRCLATTDRDHAWVGGEGGALLATESGGAASDVARPRTSVLSRATLIRGQATVRFRVTDPDSPQVLAGVEVRNAGGRVVLRSWFGAVRVGTAVTKQFVCRLRTGTYRCLVIAEDPNGNREEHAAAVTLTVR